MKRRILPLTIGAAATALVAAAFLRDLRAAKRRIASGSRSIDSGIEYAESGDGPPLLIVHGAGGGWDQGLAVAGALLGDKYRIISPSRFGYLRTPLPEDASAEAQAAAHARVLDALGIDRVPVIGISAGGPSAMQFCLKYPERCSALILIVPLAYPPKKVAPLRFFGALVKAIAASDFFFWAGTKIAHKMMVETILGTPIRDYWTASDDERQDLDEFLRWILPISRRASGIANDAAIASALPRYDLEAIRVPTLVISAEDCLYGTFKGSVYTAEHVPHAKLVTFKRGGHLLVGHVRDVQSEIASFLSVPFGSSVVKDPVFTTEGTEGTEQTFA
jgi:pimeloyl-ACP methyl ester carboxylesterase